MYLLTFEQENKSYLGVKQGSKVINITSLSEIYNQSNNVSAVQLTDMLSLIQQGFQGISSITRLLEWSDSNPSVLPSVTCDEIKIKAPLTNPGKVVCVGNNYLDHCREQNVEPPKKPMIFSKWPSCIIGPNEHILLPEDSKQVDFEAELAVVIGQRAKNVSEQEAMDYVFGYTILNDISARDVQFEDGQWVRGKSYDTFAPMGPVLVTADEIDDPHHLNIKLDINGKVLQDSNTKHMIFKIPYLIAYLSKGFTFEPGDILATGTPHGVGVFRNPEVFLQTSDKCTIEIEKIGRLVNSVV